MVLEVDFLRDCLAWKKENLDLGSSSNEACKLYDASLQQYVKWFDSPQHNGLESTMDNMLKADPEFVLGHCLKLGLESMGSSASLCQPDYAEKVNALVKLAKSRPLSPLQLMHVNGIRNMIGGHLTKACECWETILIDHPTDMLALKLAHDAYFYLGAAAEMRDSVNRVLAKWKPAMTMYSYLYGMSAFGFAQSNFFKEAETHARTALELSPHDAWATHALAHVTEYRNDWNWGIKFLRETEKDWSVCNYIAPHNYWHLCLYHLERDEKDVALDVYDQVISKYPPGVLNMVDSASLLFRLKLDGVGQAELKDRWASLKDAYKSKADEHGYVFNDLHILMMLSESGSHEETQSFFKSLDSYINQQQFVMAAIEQSNNMDTEDVDSEDKENISKLNSKRRSSRKYNDEQDLMSSLTEKCGTAIYNSIISFDKGEYERVVELLNPIRYQLVRIGGSNAQRDLFHQLLCQSALRSSRSDHKNLGLALLNERLALKPNSCLTQRIIRRFASNHSD